MPTKVLIALAVVAASVGVAAPSHASPQVPRLDLLGPVHLAKDGSASVKVRFRCPTGDPYLLYLDFGRAQAGIGGGSVDARCTGHTQTVTLPLILDTEMPVPFERGELLEVFGFLNDFDDGSWDVYLPESTTVRVV